MRRYISLVGHGLLGWAICGATVAVGRQIFSMNLTLWIHAVVAPTAFGILSRHHVKAYPGASPVAMALAMVGLVVGMDALVVAPFLERSYEMFRSVLGTWVPFALIFAATYSVTAATRNRAGRARTE